MLENELQAMEIRPYNKWKSKVKEWTTHQGEVNNLKNILMKKKIKEPEENMNNYLALNSVLDIKPIRKEMNKLIELDHEHNKRVLNLIIFTLKEEK